jgi:DNA-binding response OmpR family regulator
MAKRILIAEDEPNIVMTLEFLFTQAGYVVRSTGSGEEALQALSCAPADLLLLDVMLPDLNGFEICRRVRDNPRLKACKIILLTAQGGNKAVQKGFAVGADAYVTKPFSTRELMSAVRALVGP